MRPKNPRHPILALAGASVLATVLILVACDTRVPAPTAATEEEISSESVAPVLDQQSAGDPSVAAGAEGEGARVTVTFDQSLRADEGPPPRPLFIVDGVIVTTDAYEQLKIEASDIQSIEVVKGAAAAARYGSRAQNGVILITTKDAPGGGGA